MPTADEVIQRARSLTAAAFDDLASLSGLDSSFAHDVLDAWYEREQHETTTAGVDYFRRQAAFQLLLGLTCLPTAAPPVARPEEATAEVAADEGETDLDATPPLGTARSERSEEEKLSRRERRRRG
jgi:hypothetical protein